MSFLLLRCLAEQIKLLFMYICSLQHCQLDQHISLSVWKEESLWVSQRAQEVKR